MVKVIAQFFIAEGRLSDAIAAAKELVGKTRAEKGCLQYDMFQDNADSANLVLIEGWATQEDLDVHSESAHFQSLVPKIVGLCAKPPVIQKLTQII